MTTATVTTQAQLDAALADASNDLILINSPRGVWLDLSSSDSATVQASGSATVQAYDSATVQASGSATVRAYDSATVQAYDSATVQASGSATVQAYDSATVRAYGSAAVRAYGSAAVRAYGSATVQAYDSATVQAYDSATVQAYGSAAVRASGSATVQASDSATVQASGSAAVRAYDSATVQASSHVAVHLHSAHVDVTGGVVINVAALDLTDPITWTTYHGVEIEETADLHMAVLYKAVDGELTAGREYDKPTVYTVGTEVTCDDWRDDNNCGGGLHVSPRPDQAATFQRADTIRYLRVHVPVDSLRPIEADKCKAASVFVVAEVDALGRDLVATVSEAPA